LKPLATDNRTSSERLLGQLYAELFPFFISTIGRETSCRSSRTLTIQGRSSLFKPMRRMATNIGQESRRQARA